jgi:hypothetical protein
VIKLKKQPYDGPTGADWNLVDGPSGRLVGFRLTFDEAAQIEVALKYHQSLAAALEWAVTAMQYNDPQEIQAAWAEASRVVAKLRADNAAREVYSGRSTDPEAGDGVGAGDE